MSDERLVIAQVTPYPWEGRREVNEYVNGLSDALASRGHSVIVETSQGSLETRAIVGADGVAGVTRRLAVPS